MSHAEHRQRQEQILRQALAILTHSAYVRGVMIDGSGARGQADAFSDIDLACYLGDEERTGRLELYEQIGAIAPLLCKLWVHDLHALYLFTDGVRLDLDFHPRSAMALAGGKGTILYDPDGTLHLCPPPATTTVAPHPQDFVPGDPAYLEWFLWMFRQIYCWTKRGAQGSSKGFDKLLNACESLSQVRSSLIQMRLWTLGHTSHLMSVDPDFAQRIARTFPHLEPGEMLATTRLLLAEYETIVPAYCAKAAITYPAEKVAALKQQFAEFDALS